MVDTTSPVSAPDLAELNDFPALRQLGHALWRTEGTRGAALLVGAGVSCGARLSGADTARPPLWADLARFMTQELYPSDPKRAPTDPLRLAEEFRTYFGQAALDAFVRRHIVDIGWTPSANHHALLDLPWSDVLTTNYDTLLERAARTAKTSYEPVLSQADLAHARAPRIVKLHGSIGSSEHFIIAEEDYRTYPVTHAGFVNLARQVFVENELCLIGFSGDDPNFAAWAGWVRDHLGSSARRIYLAGALNLGPAKRKFLEARNIAPIDVHAAVGHLDPAERHEAATRIILDSLGKMRPIQPHKWSPHAAQHSVPNASRDPVADAETLDSLIETWRTDRVSYPGWLICPYGERRALRIATDAARLSEAAIALLQSARAAELMVELCWRHRIAFWPLQPHLTKLVERFADPAQLSRTDQLLVATTLLKQARKDEDRSAFERFAGKIEALAEADSDALAELRHEAAAWACEEMNFSGAADQADQIVGADPIWKIRRAALLAETGLLVKAEAMVADAVEDLRERQRGSRQSLWVRSRLAWADFLATAFRRDDFEATEWPHHYRETRCDPWKEIESLTGQIKSDVRKKHRSPARLTPRFNAGSYHDPSRTIHFESATEVNPVDELNALLQDAGVPPSLTHLQLFTDDKLDGLELSFERTLAWYRQFCRSGLSRSNPLLDRYFARVAIAALPRDVVEHLVERLKSALSHWIARIVASQDYERQFAANRLALVLELLGRLVIRLDSDAAMEMHLAAVDLWMKPELRAFILNEPIRRLLENSFQAVRPEDRPRLLEPDLRLPLSDNTSMPEPVNWLGNTSPALAVTAPQFRQNVDALIQAVEPGQANRTAAISRLTYLADVGALQESELERFGAAAWAQIDQGEPPLPAQSAIFPHYWAKVPAPADRDPQDAVRRRLFELSEPKLNSTHYGAMIRGARSGATRPTEEEARAAFDRLAALRPAAVDQSDFAAMMQAAFAGYDHEAEAHLIGATLTWALAPYLAPEDRTEARALAIQHFVAETGSLSAAGGLVSFLESQSAASVALATFIRRGLVARNEHTVAYAADALAIWCETTDISEPHFPAQSVEQLVSVIELRRAPALWRLLDLAEMLVRKGAISGDQPRRLAASLGDLLVEADYAGIDPQSHEAGTVSLVRRECVRLATVLQETSLDDPALLKWIETGSADPLPEVRYGSTEED